MTSQLQNPKPNQLHEYHIEIDDHRVHYVVLHPAQQRTIVMVHGFRGNHRGLLHIAERLPTFRILIPDLPGYGKTLPWSDRKHDIENYSQIVGAFIDALELTNFVLLGHSFGALIAAHLAATKPTGITSLILINPVSHSSRTLARLAKLYFSFGLSLPHRFGRRFLTSRTLNRLQSRLMMKTTDPALRRAIIDHHLHDLELPYYRAVIADGVATVLEKTMFAYAKQITVPTLLIGGDNDDLAPLAAQQQLQTRMPHARLVIIPRVGHFIHLEKPAEAAEIITKELMG